jgi:MFS family permease
MRRWLVLALVFFGIVISYIDRGNLSIAAESIMRDLHLQPQSMGLLLSAFFWTYGLCQIPAGLLIDRYGVRMLYAVAFCFWSLASASIALSRGPGDIIASRLVLGIAESVGPLASMVFIRQNFANNENALPVSIYIAGQTVGPACGALLGSTLLATYGWRALFAATGLGALLWPPLWLALAPKRPVLVLTKAGEPPRTNWPWRAIVTHPAFWATTVCTFLFNYYWWFFMTWMPAYLTMSRGFSTVSMGRTLSVPLFAMAFTNIASGFLADRLVSRNHAAFKVRVFFCAFGFSGASLVLLLNITTGRGSVIPILVASICCFGVGSASFWTLAQALAPSGAVGRVVGYLNTISQVAGTFAPLVTGFILGPQRDFHLAIGIAGCCPLAASGLLLYAAKRMNLPKGRSAFTLPAQFAAKKV